jgi:hypothetical protein
MRIDANGQDWPKWRILGHNPADAVGGLRVEKTKMPALKSHETVLLLAHFLPSRLGHSRIGIALDLYFHVMPGMQEDAAAKVDAAMRAAIDRVAG